MRTFLLICFLCQPTFGKDKFYGEYEEPAKQTANCASALSQVNVKTGRLEKVIVGTLGTLILSALGFVSYDYVSREWARSKVNWLVTEVRETPLPVKDESLRRKTADHLASLLLLKLAQEGDSHIEYKRERVIRFLRRHPWIWHHGGGEELAKRIPWGGLVTREGDSKNDYRGLRGLFREAMYEELGSGATNWASALGFELEVGGGVDFDDGATRAKKEFQRILTLPLHTDSDPEGYRRLLSQVLFDIDVQASESDQSLGSDVVRNLFGPKEAARYVAFAEKRMEGISSFEQILSAISNADRDATVGQAVEKAGLKFYVNQPNPFIEFKASGAAKSTSVQPTAPERKE